ncbi:lytic transglycosylase domain-containing protein [uncultured Ruminococcus sp.]|uniref:lytic transglycosylase domain-containing protein n=1 Tax=uncultured Ruminococcus sp. TaxID=165186 RepID=UPI0025ECE9E3|nr:lytic transglycosylase domain-containing protein [uncultured Ruminococcus sp.]
MAASNYSNKKKKKKANDFLIVVIGIFAAFAILFIMVCILKRGVENSLREMKDKTEEYVPSGFTYSTDYEEYVEKYSEEFEVDPVLIFSVIKVESNFQPRATSNVGARGLMQLMEEAYDWVKFRLDDDSESFDDMYDPETNIRYGTYYLSFLMERYDGSIDLTAAAYHCGMGQVDSWLEDGTISAENFDVNDIPAENDQTSHYVNKINDAYSAYSELLAENSSTEDSSTEEEPTE